MTHFDITAKIGELFYINTPECLAEWPMYSFDMPSRILWNAIGKRLAHAGWTEDQIREWLQSKATRLALDDALGDAIEKVGSAWAENILKGRQ